MDISAFLRVGSNVRFEVGWGAAMSKFGIIKKYIDEYDYYNLLACHAPQDEFDSYSRKLANEINDNDTVENIATLIAKTMDKAFGEEIKPEKFLETAQKIRSALYEVD